MNKEQKNEGKISKSSNSESKEGRSDEKEKDRQVETQMNK